MIAVCMNKNSYTCEMIQESKEFNLTILDERAPFSLFRRFGFQSGRTVDKFSDYEYKELAQNGIYYVTEGANAVLSCKVETILDLGSHLLFTATIGDSKVLSDVPSMSYTYYHEHVREQAPKKEEGRKAWRCIICGYVYDHPDLPEDFICPWCGHPASDFEEIRI